MSILSSNHPIENQVTNSISRFLSGFQVIRLFRACGCVKAKGISVEFLFTYVLGNAFRSSSFYMQQRMREPQRCFSKNTYYRFLTDSHVNWLHFTTRLAVRVIEQFWKPMPSEERWASMIPSTNALAASAQSLRPACSIMCLCVTKGIPPLDAWLDRRLFFPPSKFCAALLDEG